MKGLGLLFRFMTRLPLPGREEFDSVELGKSMKYFPIVGMVLGFINLGVYLLLDSVVPSEYVMALILVTLDVIITGGLHLDGLADTFDGIFSYRSKQKMLDIMKDSRIGTNGTLVLILYFIFKIIFLVEVSKLLVVNQGIVMLLVPVLSRINGVLNCATEPYARGTGMGKTFVDNTTLSDAGFSYVITSIFLYVVSVKTDLTFIDLFIVFNGVVGAGVFFGKLMTRKIGGITGDTLGALLELSGVLSLVLMYFIF